jgi:two-component system, cell cycle sensor histidine kinase and response regulator CckA
VRGVTPADDRASDDSARDADAKGAGARPNLLVAHEESAADVERRMVVRTRRVVRAVRRVDEAVRTLSRERFGVAILDCRIEDDDAWPVAEETGRTTPGIPVVVVTGVGGETSSAAPVDAAALERRVRTRGGWQRLPLVVERVARHVAAENEHALLASVVQFSDDAMFAESLDGEIRSWNPAAERMFGWSADELVGRSAAPLYPADRESEFVETLTRLARGEHLGNRETVRLRKDGARVDVAESVSPIRGDEGRVVGLAVVVRDIRERRNLEAQFRQAQKMEAVGRLAGGVAHDFNNLLTVINGYCAMLLENAALGAPGHRELIEIATAGERASTLVHRLMAFSRKQVCAPRAADLNAIVRDMEGLLRRLIGEDVHLRTALDDDLGTVMVDVGQIEQVIVNLAVNARDAMPRGGRLVIETRGVDVDEEFARRRPEVTPGPYVLLAVTDDGCGMDEETRSHLFEPYFTTKGRRGTGLGLSTVHGIVRQAGGHIEAYSEPSRGTTFRIYLPRHDAPAEEAATVRPPAPLARGTETIVLAEDDEAIRNLARRVLEASGYTVIATRDGAEALARCETHAGEIDLLITDVVMRTMGGADLANCLATRRPSTRVLYMSGYTDETIVFHGGLDPNAPYLEKPFTPDLLLRKVREVLDAPRS